MTPTAGPAKEGAPRVAVCSLGCSKNLVDTENMMGMIRAAGMEIVSDEGEADVVLVNTCGFIADAAQESVDSIIEYAHRRSRGEIRALVVTGCLVQRYGRALTEEMPEVDAIVGTGEYGRCVEAIQGALRGEKLTIVGKAGYLASDGSPRVVSTPQHYAYIKIGEGCANRCAYCLIPSLRGPVRSRPLESIVREAQGLAAQGVREAILVAQDTTRYGQDIYGGPSLPALLRAVARVDGIEWIRVMYAYPSRIDEELISVFEEERKVVKYMDIPMQHGSDRVLTAMNRSSSREQMMQTVREIRARIPRVVIRTSLIVGFPGETEADVDDLLDFVDTVRPERAGVFEFSAEEGTPAFDMRDQVPSSIAKERRGRVMEALAAISLGFGRSRVGTVVRVIVDGPSAESDLLVDARSYAEAPEVDGTVFVGDATLRQGEFVDVRITDARDYDAAAEVVSRPPAGNVEKSSGHQCRAHI
ncbi:MAG: 30S ribosomal protein S12 methylthiotransferase RimO [Clostridia bacterium]|nr:30S ribosomal protein S12 methylthiotransferase RimO [Clostridia bacterium]